METAYFLLAPSEAYGLSFVPMSPVGQSFLLFKIQEQSSSFWRKQNAFPMSWQMYHLTKHQEAQEARLDQ